MEMGFEKQGMKRNLKSRVHSLDRSKNRPATTDTFDDVQLIVVSRHLMLDFLSHVGDIGVCSELSEDEFLSRTIRLIRWPLQRSPSPLKSCRDRGRTGSTLVPQENDATPELGMETFQLLSLIAVITVAGCTTEPNKGNAQFIVKVDSMTHPSFAVTADTITIRLFGTIGPDGCHLFSHFEERRQPLGLDLTVW